jgi:hypothetical protein
MLALLVCIGCVGLGGLPVLAETTFKSSDSTLQIKMPDGWKQGGMPPGSPESLKIILGNEKLDALVTVEVDDTDTFSTLDACIKAKLDAYKTKFGDLTHTDPKSLKIGGKDALRCECKSTQNGVKVASVVTVIKAGTQFQTTIGSTAIEYFPRLKGALARASETVTDLTPPAGPDLVVKGKDGLVQLTLSGNWKEEPRPQEAGASFQLLAHEWKQDIYVQVVSQARADTTQSLKENLQALLDELTKTYPGTTHTDPQAIKVAGFDGLQCEAELAVTHGKIASLITALQTPTQYLLVHAYCPQPKYTHLKPAMLKATNSIKELAASNAVVADSGFVGRPVVLKGKDGTVQMTVPRQWKTEKAPPESDNSVQISAANAQDGDELLLLVQPRAKTPGDKTPMDLKTYTNRTLEEFNHSPNITGISHTDPAAVQIDGHDAMQFEFHFTSDGVKTAYLIASIQTDKNFIRLQCWTTESRFQKLKTAFTDLASAIKEVKPGDDDNN